MAVTVSETVTTTPSTSERVSSGVEGLDDILGGGLTKQRLYLLEGTPGTGKTTLALQFLLEGARAGESGLYVTLSETAEELRAVAASHGWSLDGIELYELVNEDGLGPESEQSILHPSEIELGETVQSIMARVRELKPKRVVFDSLSDSSISSGSVNAPSCSWTIAPRTRAIYIYTASRTASSRSSSRRTSSARSGGVCRS
jgi:circadian clock protein KaiC